MSLYFWVSVVVSVGALLFIAVYALLVIRRVLLLARRAGALQSHPTLLALRQAQSIAARLRSLQAPVSEIRALSLRIAESMAAFGAASAALDLDVDRISFATRLLLETFVPTLRGSMAD